MNLIRQPFWNTFDFEPIDHSAAVYVEFIDSASNINGVRIQPYDFRLGKRSPKEKWNKENKNLATELASLYMPPGILAKKKKVVHGTILVAATFEQGNDIEADVSSKEHSQSVQEVVSPVIEVQELEKLEKVYQGNLIISGRIKGEFQDFKINSQVKIARGRNVRFSFKQPLVLNEKNEITLEIADKTGAPCPDCTKHFTITRFPEPEKIPQFRASAILFPPEKDGGDGELREGLLNDLRLKLMEEGRFRMPATSLEIQRMAEKEFRLKQDGWIEASTAARYGKRVKAE